MIYVCSLARLHATVVRTRARHLVTLLSPADRIDRPPTVPADNHLFLRMDDIADPADGRVHPDIAHVEDLLAFVRNWDRASPLVMHCWAGISRSTAAAFVTACALNPRRDEFDVAYAIRDASHTATPNPRIVGIADRLLGRQGRMTAAIAAIGPGNTAFTGVPFKLDIE